MAKEITNIVKVFLEFVYRRWQGDHQYYKHHFRVCVSKMAKEITNIVKIFLELVYQRAIRRSPI
jgi:hypothetical protein